MNWILYVLTYLVGIGAGFLNVVAGGGSMLTLPLLTFLGLGIGVANGTNRVAILLQNIVATRQFKREKVNVLRKALTLAIPATLGAIVGTLIVVQIDRNMLQKIVGVLLLAMGAFMISKPSIWEKGLKSKNKNKWLSYLIFFAIGIYGGFIQAGVSFFFIAALVLVEGLDLIKTSAAKVTIIAIYTVASLTIFVANGKVDWIIGFVLAVGNMTGAVLGTKFTILKGAKWIKYVVFVAIIAGAVKFLVF